jgi:hypothetical protein
LTFFAGLLTIGIHFFKSRTLIVAGHRLFYHEYLCVETTNRCALTGFFKVAEPCPKIDWRQCLPGLLTQLKTSGNGFFQSSGEKFSQYFKKRLSWNLPGCRFPDWHKIALYFRVMFP